MREFYSGVSTLLFQITKYYKVDIFKMLKEKKTVSQESCIQQNGPSENEGKVKIFQVNKKWGNLLPLDLACEKC